MDNSGKLITPKNALPDTTLDEAVAVIVAELRRLGLSSCFIEQDGYVNIGVDGVLLSMPFSTASTAFKSATSIKALIGEVDDKVP